MTRRTSLPAKTSPNPRPRTGRRREHAEFRAYAAHRDPGVRARLIRGYLPLANTIARRFDHGRVPREDLQQIAALGLIKAIDRFDPDKGTAFSSYAVPTIEGEIRRYFRDFSWMVRPPRDLQERAIRIESEREQLTIERGRNPTAAELAHRLDCTVEDVLEAAEAARARDFDSFDRPASGEDNEDTLGELLGAEDPGFTTAEAAATLDDLLTTLSPRDTLVLRLRFHEGLSQAEIGRRVGYSQMHISRILQATLAQLTHAAHTADS